MTFLRTDHFIEHLPIMIQMLLLGLGMGVAKAVKEHVWISGILFSPHPSLHNTRGQHCPVNTSLEPTTSLGVKTIISPVFLLRKPRLGDGKVTTHKHKASRR